MSGPPNSAQRINIAVANDLHHLCHEIKSVCSLSINELIEMYRVVTTRLQCLSQVIDGQHRLSETGMKVIENGLKV